MSEVKKKRGRPEIPYDPVIGDRICELLSTTDMGLEQVLDQIKGELEGVPHLATIWRWLSRHEDFATAYTRARELQATVIFDRAQQWAQNPWIGETKKIGERNGKRIVEVTKGDNVQRAQLAVQTALKRAGHLNPKKYSEKLSVAGDPDLPVKVQVEFVGAPTGKALKPPPEDCK
jgi:hypothetical protein